jgi:hypothetical protein
MFNLGLQREASPYVFKEHMRQARAWCFQNAQYTGHHIFAPVQEKGGHLWQSTESLS